MFPVFYSDEFLDHDCKGYHPENPGRLRSVAAALRSAPWSDRLDWQTPKPAALDDRRLTEALFAIHPQSYVVAVERLANSGGGQIDADTYVSPRSFDVALLAVNAWLDAIDRVLKTNNPAFVLSRPPGHHAVREIGMGFCIFSNAAIAAHYALKQPGIERVGILDWDVHHGNGTQACVEDNPQIRFCSLHQSPHYPGTGRADERGKFENVLNLPMRAGSSIADYEPLFEQKVIPFFEEFQPDLLIVSAGYDATTGDPLAQINLEPEDFGRFTRYCLKLTRRIVFGLEGGYEYDDLARSISATIEACLE
ncbi:histone deacetylase [Microcoleus sp. FACHB-1515]|uniref:histone deacetylase family protein n=1 Tax=Cyanophyceae TaxID=3028117 RepID=UPI001687A69F|nr:histone deacetylase [Microcoleus sp. FACHB-1515]MBD2091199.1 histone deacetylase [Microcoleus sp. FACHB-1515]